MEPWTRSRTEHRRQVRNRAFVMGPFAFGAALLAVIALTAGCSSSGNKDTTTTTTPASSTSASATGATGGGSSSAFVDIETCDNTGGGGGTATGTIQNTSDAPVTYTLTIGFTDDSDGTQVASGTTTTASVAPGQTRDWSIDVTGLGSGDVTCHTISIDSDGGSDTATTTAKSTSGSAGTSDTEFPCSLITQAHIESLAGNKLDGDATTSHVTENDVEYVAKVCTWTNNESNTAVEVTLSVSRTEDFGSGSVGCPPLADGNPLSEVGPSASWSWTGAGTAVEVGELRVCTPDALVTVRVSAAGSEEAVKTIAKKVYKAVDTEL